MNFDRYHVQLPLVEFLHIGGILLYCSFSSYSSLAGLGIRSFLKWAIALFLERKMSDLENCSFFAHFRSFLNSERVIALFVALFERAKEQSLFLKEQQSDR